MDVIVALMILSATFVLSFVGTQTARDAAVRAEEVRQAEVLLRALMMDGVRSLTPARGERGGFSWFVEMDATPAVRPVALCNRQVVVQNERSARSYATTTIETCPAPDS